MTDPKHEQRVHTVCEYMKRVRGENETGSPVCKECPAWEIDPHYGKMKRMCRSLAEEVMSIVIHGTPFPPQWKPGQE